MKKTAIVTGASRGIGYAIAKQLGKDGFNIVMVATGSKGKNIDAIKQLEEETIEEHGRRLLNEKKAKRLDQILEICPDVEIQLGLRPDRKSVV